MGNNVPSTERRTSPDITVRFYCPLKVMRYEYDKYGNLDYGSESEYGGRFANRYKGRIRECLEGYLEDDDMAKYFDGSRGATEKLKSAVWGFESREGVLYGCITATLAAPFTQKEEVEFKEWCVGQNADGLGEGAEQQEIEIDDGVMYVSYWHSGDDYFLDNEREFEQRFRETMEMEGI